MFTMNFRSLALTVLALAAPVAAFAADSVPAPAQASASSVAPSTAAADDADGRKVICKREAQVGSLIATRVCKTAAVWQLERENAQKMIGDMQQHTGSTGGK
jgi:invasion protein IalB